MKVYQWVVIHFEWQNKKYLRVLLKLVEEIMFHREIKILYKRCQIPIGNRLGCKVYCIGYKSMTEAIKGIYENSLIDFRKCVITTFHMLLWFETCFDLATVAVGCCISDSHVQHPGAREREDTPCPPNTRTRIKCAICSLN